MKWFFDIFSSWYINNKEHISLDYALFRNQNVAQDGGFLYANLFDASVDAFVYAMEREGFQGIKIVVSETGWATGGGEAASVANAMAYTDNVVRRVANYVGTPRQPNEEMEVYLFDLFDENEKNGEEFTSNIFIGYSHNYMVIYEFNYLR